MTFLACESVHASLLHCVHCGHCRETSTCTSPHLQGNQHLYIPTSVGKPAPVHPHICRKPAPVHPHMCRRQSTLHASGSLQGRCTELMGRFHPLPYCSCLCLPYLTCKLHLLLFPGAVQNICYTSGCMQCYRRRERSMGPLSSISLLPLFTEALIVTQPLDLRACLTFVHDHITLLKRGATTCRLLVTAVHSSHDPGSTTGPA